MLKTNILYQTLKSIATARAPTEAKVICAAPESGVGIIVGSELGISESASIVVGVGSEVVDVGTIEGSSLSTKDGLNDRLGAIEGASDCTLEGRVER